MGVDVIPKVVIGISVAEFIEEKIISDSYEEHDARGNKTGNTIVEKKRVYVIKTNDDVKESNDFYDLLDVEDYPSKNKFGMFSLNYEDNNLEDYIVGIMIGECDAMYGEIDEVDANEVLATIDEVQSEVIKRFGSKVNPKLYLIGGCSY